MKIEGFDEYEFRVMHWMRGVAHTSRGPLKLECRVRTDPGHSVTLHYVSILPDSRLFNFVDWITWMTFQPLPRFWKLQPHEMFELKRYFVDKAKREGYEYLCLSNGMRSRGDYYRVIRLRVTDEAAAEADPETPAEVVEGVPSDWAYL